jgi:hypothetical protein
MISETHSRRRSLGAIAAGRWNAFSQTTVGDVFATLLSISFMFAVMLACVIAIVIVVEIGARILH